MLRDGFLPILVAGAVGTWAAAALAGEARPAGSGFGALPGVSDGELGAMRGREGLVVIDATAEQNLNATISSSGVSAEVVNTGPVSLEGAALQNMDGFANVLANSGINSNLQATMAVIVVLQ